MKFSIVTPTYNGEKYLAETIESIINQKGKFEIELIFVDNLSTDDTINIINNYNQKLIEKSHPIHCKSITFKIISEKDKGMYDALNKGFSLATGDIYAWSNSDDIYLPGAFEVVSDVFENFKKILWLKGITSYIDESSKLTRFGKCYLYYQKWIRMGVYGRKLYFLQQSSTFWRPELWRKVNGLDGKLKLAGDFGLWLKFAQYTPLYSLNFKTDCFRFRSGQLSEDKSNYYKECDLILPLSSHIEKKINSYKKYRVFFPDFFRPFIYLIILGFHKFHLIDIVINKEKYDYKLRKFYIYDFWNSLY